MPSGYFSICDRISISALYSLENILAMRVQEIVTKWFEIWENGNFEDIPVCDQFKHTSPYGTIEGKEEYLNLVTANRDKFLGHKFIIHDELFGDNKGCIHYTAVQGDFRLDVSEWHYIEGNCIKEIVAHYNIEGEISEERKLKNL